MLLTAVTTSLTPLDAFFNPFTATTTTHGMTAVLALSALGRTSSNNSDTQASQKPNSITLAGSEPAPN